MRTARETGWRFHADLPAAQIQSLTELCKSQSTPGTGEDVNLRTEALALLGEGTPGDTHWQGPVYAFPDEPATRGAIKVVSISEENEHLLQPGMSDWLPDVAHRAPFMAAIADDQAVAVCVSVRIGRWMHEAGVETQPAYRGSGFARAVVGAWAAAVRGLGVRPIYSTSHENEASQALARSSGLQLIGSDLHFR